MGGGGGTGEEKSGCEPCAITCARVDSACAELELGAATILNNVEPRQKIKRRRRLQHADNAPPSAWSRS